MPWLRSKTFEVLPALSVRGKELRSSLRRITVAWMFGSVWMIGIGGATMGHFAHLLGFEPRDWGIWQAIGFAAMLAQLVASYIVENTGLRKITFLGTTTLHRMLWIPMGIFPLLLLWFPSMPAGAAVWMAFSLLFVSCVLGNLGSPAWVTWMSDLIPPRIRGRYFARRNAIAIVVQIIATLSLGFLLDWTIRDGRPLTVADQPMLAVALTIVFAVAGAAGMVDILLFRRIRDVVPPRPPQPTSFGRILVEPLRNRRFVHYVSATAMLTFGTALSGPFFIPLCQDVLRLNSTATNLVLTVFGPVGGIVSSRFWGRVTDRWGRRPVMILCTLGTAYAVWGWVHVPFNQLGAVDQALWGFVGRWIATPANPPALATVGVAALVVFFGGVIWTGLGIAQFNTILSFSDEQGRSTYVASASILTSIAGLLGGLAGGFLAQSLQGLHWRLGPFLLVNYHVVFLISGAIRGFSAVFLFGMADPGAKPTRDMVRAMVTNGYHNLTTKIIAPMRIVVGSRRASYRLTSRREGKDEQPPS